MNARLAQLIFLFPWVWITVLITFRQKIFRAVIKLCLAFNANNQQKWQISHVW